MEKPIKYSWKTITYGRSHLIVEILHSFLIQEDLSDCEMVIVNDYPLQKLVFDHPKVRIFNLDTTFDTIGDKENFAIEQCKGDVIIVADDDDVAMPWHMSNITQYFEQNANILHWQNAVFYNEPDITKLCPVGNSGIVYSRKAWEAIGKSPIENAGGDMTLVKAIHALDESKVIRAHPPDNRVSWWYRWATPLSDRGLGDYHLSGMGTDTPDRPNIIERNSAYVEQMRRMGRVPTGKIELVPQWRKNYIKLLEDYVR